MTLSNLLNTLKQLDGLIRRKCTGCPPMLAQKLGVSERTLYRLLDQLRNDLNVPIIYDSDRQSYIYAETGRIIFGFVRKLDDSDMQNITGGGYKNILPTAMRWQ